MKGSLLTHQISVSCRRRVVSKDRSVPLSAEPREMVGGLGRQAYGLEGLLVLDGEGTGLQGDDWGGGLGVVVDGRAALAAEDTVDGLAGGTDTSPALGGARDGELVLGDDSYEGCVAAVLVDAVQKQALPWAGLWHTVGRTSLALAVVAVVVSDTVGRRVNSVLDLAAKAVTGETHVV